jgi:MYXO-CTERM domain-containing protein
MRASLATVLLLVASPAAAHFKLVAPASTLVQEPTGDPQKDPPCGGAGTASNEVTAVQTGSSLTITVLETVFHPGHYRVSLAPTEAELPDDPAVTPGTTACGSLAIDPDPTLPLLADGQLVHTSAFTGPQSFQIQLPAGMECDHCVLQVVEFMSSHGAPCFYHHCATVTISNTAPPPAPDAGVPPEALDPNAPPATESGGCCSTGGGPAGAGVLALGVAALLVRRRRR